MLDKNCTFCKILKGELPSYKLFEDSKVYAFLDINPISEGHLLVIPKFHAIKTHEVPNEYLEGILPVISRLALAMNLDNYNILQNNGRVAGQVVNHVHYHLIPRPDTKSGLRFTFHPISTEKTEFQKASKQIVDNLG